MFKNKSKTGNGFTLIEILVVIGLIAILAAIVLIAINPGRQFAQARNSQRQSNVETILNAIGQRMADNKGVFAGGGCTEISTFATTSIDVASGGVAGGSLVDQDFATNCLVPTYIPALPIDPAGVAAPLTGYQLREDAVTHRIMVCAPLASSETAISNPPPIVCITR